MKITVLMENAALPGFACEHGLSLLIETDSRKILFDAGQSGAFADNADTLGVDLSQVDFAVLSHGHYDHGGGMLTFLERNHSAPLYLRETAFDAHYNGSSKYIGLDEKLRDTDRLHFVSGKLPLGENITLHSGAELPTPFGIRPFGLTVRRNGAFLPETFGHEQYLLIEENGKRICFSGCSHRGVLNILRHFHPHVLVGGFHFSKLDPAGEDLRRAAGVLLEGETVYYTGHCTGQAQFDALKAVLGDRLRSIHAGMVFEI